MILSETSKMVEITAMVILLNLWRFDSVKLSQTVGKDKTALVKQTVYLSFVDGDFVWESNVEAEKENIEEKRA